MNMFSEPIRYSAGLTSTDLHRIQKILVDFILTVFLTVNNLFPPSINFVGCPDSVSLLAGKPAQT